MYWFRKEKVKNLNSRIGYLKSKKHHEKVTNYPITEALKSAQIAAKSEWIDAEKNIEPNIYASFLLKVAL